MEPPRPAAETRSIVKRMTDGMNHNSKQKHDKFRLVMKLGMEMGNQDPQCQVAIYLSHSVFSELSSVKSTDFVKEQN